MLHYDININCQAHKHCIIMYFFPQAVKDIYSMYIYTLDPDICLALDVMHGLHTHEHLSLMDTVTSELLWSSPHYANNPMFSYIIHIIKSHRHYTCCYAHESYLRMLM